MRLVVIACAAAVLVGAVVVAALGRAERATSSELEE
jgi:hypothetical protein